MYAHLCVYVIGFRCASDSEAHFVAPCRVVPDRWIAFEDLMLMSGKKKVENFQRKFEEFLEWKEVCSSLPSLHVFLAACISLCAGRMDARD